jgi:hypothetical protein
MTVDAESDIPEALENDGSEAAEREAPRLALGRTVMVAYAFVLSHPGRFLFFAAVPLAGLYSGELLAISEPALFFFKLVFVSVFALFWHRLMLAGSLTSGLDARGLILGGLRFCGYCFLMALFLNAFMAGAAWVFGFGLLAVTVTHGFGVIKPLLRRAFRSPSLALVALFLIACGAAYYEDPSRATTDFMERALPFVMLIPLARVLLALPAVAMTEKGDLIAGAWHRSRGSDIQLCLGLALCLGPFEGVRWGMRQALDAPHSSDVTVAVAALFSSLLLLLGIAVASSFLCASYRQLAGAGGGIGVLEFGATARRPAPGNRLPDASRRRRFEKHDGSSGDGRADLAIYRRSIKIVLFEWLFYAGFAMHLVVLPLKASAYHLEFHLIDVLPQIAVGCGLVWLIAHRGRRWPIWIFVPVFVVWLAATLGDSHDLSAVNPPAASLMVTQLMLLLAGWVFLFWHLATCLSLVAQRRRAERPAKDDTP